MNYRLFLVSAVLTRCTVGESLVNHGPDKVLAFEGGDVILPCSFNITASSDFPTVEWSKEGLEPNVVFLYRDGCETYEMKHQDFEFRTSLIPKELKHGNISLRISNVRLSDAGWYQCMTLWRNDPRSVTAVELVVDALSEPILSVVSSDCGGVTLQCEANYSLSEPHITFLDDRGKEIPAENQKRAEHAGGGYTVRRRTTLHSATHSITCRVQQPEFSLVKDQRIFIADDFMRVCSLTNVIIVGGISFLLVLLCVTVHCLRNRFGICAGAQKPPATRQESKESTNTSVCENELLLNDSVSSDAEDPKPNIRKQNSNPALNHVHERVKSSPARLITLPQKPGSFSAQLHSRRSTSDPYPCSTNIYQSVFPSSVPVTNRYSLLAYLNDVPEQQKAGRKSKK